MSTIDDPRTTSGADASGDSITAFLAADHRRITKLWDETIAAFAREDFNTIHVRAAEFIAALRRHIAMEEQILFPAIEEKTAMRTSGPTYAMRLEHRQIERVLDGLAPLLTVQERWTAIQAIEGELTDPAALFRSHDAKEEAVLYPMADKMLGADAARKLIERMRTEVDSPAVSAH
ncbi:MAG TPA: hemerythrin domain-containing protein [Candidatus Binataceae bacterium]|nr:hemerythrin domain-containing protein [Candidatus Binataceae bacterium]